MPGLCRLSRFAQEKLFGNYRGHVFIRFVKRVVILDLQITKVISLLSPVHTKDIPLETLKSILKQAGISNQDWDKL